MNILVIGKPSFDIILPVEKFPTDGEVFNLKEKIEVPSGASLYTACMLAKWGMKVSYAGIVCGDEYGTKIKNTLESFQVDTKFLEVDYEHKTGINYVLLNRASSKNTKITTSDEVYMKKYKYDFIPDYIITDGSDMPASIAATNNYPTAKIIFLANKVNDDYYNLSKKAAYVCASVKFAEALTKMQYDFNHPKTLVNLFQKIKDLNKAEYILMLRDKGVMYIKDRSVKMIPTINIEKKDDSNSGSAFFAAFAYGIINGIDIETTAKIANIAGGLALTKVGTIHTIPELSEVYNLAGLKQEEKGTTDEKVE